MKKILLILMFMFSLTFVLANSGYGCTPFLNITNVTNESGLIGIEFDTCGLVEEDYKFTISTINNLGIGSGTCNKINNSICNDNSCFILTDCHFPIYNENYTHYINFWKYGTNVRSTFKFTGWIEPEINETEPNETIIEPIVKKKSSGSSSSIKCSVWSGCLNGVQTQYCENSIIKTKACEQTVFNATANVENGSNLEGFTEYNGTEVVKDLTTEQTGLGTEQPKENNHNFTWIIAGIIFLIIVIAFVIVHFLG